MLATNARARIEVLDRPSGLFNVVKDRAAEGSSLLRVTLTSQTVGDKEGRVDPCRASPHDVRPIAVVVQGHRRKRIVRRESPGVVDITQHAGYHGVGKAPVEDAEKRNNGSMLRDSGTVPVSKHAQFLIPQLKQLLVCASASRRECGRSLWNSREPFAEDRVLDAKVCGQVRRGDGNLVVKDRRVVKAG